MRVLLFVPCLVQDVAPEIGLATAEVLERAGCLVHPPEGQTCCGQPLYKQGHFQRTKNLARRTIELFNGEAPVVSPSASCVAMLRQYPELLRDEPRWHERALDLAGRSFELCEFLARGLDAGLEGAAFPSRAAYHESCQVRALGVGADVRAMLARVQDLDLVELENPTTCCGFGGAFSLQFPEVSAAILQEKIAAVDKAEVQTVICAEVSCLLHLRAGLQRRGRGPRALHVAEVLAGREDQGKRS